MSQHPLGRKRTEVYSVLYDDEEKEAKQVTLVRVEDATEDKPWRPGDYPKLGVYFE